MTQATTATAEVKKWDGGHSPFNLSYGKIMMWFFLLSDALTFGALLISYGTKRFFSDVWPDSNHVFKAFPGFGTANMPLMFVSLMTFILILSSVTMVLAVHAGHYKDRKAVIKWLLLTIIGGIAFLSCQCWEWVHLHSEGAWWGSFVDPATTPLSKLEHFYKPAVFEHMTIAEGVNATTSFFNFFFTITGFHGMHVLSGVVLNIMILVNTVNGTYERRGHYEMIEKVGLYWHFVDLVWVFVFTCFYLL
ncbi:MAG TPA: cytochrome c oxidase subunit 3 [Chitinophagaceae bacterium]|nr:cytochrome c oxidase subunit 3 [Chitinophagaceae bacterium]